MLLESLIAILIFSIGILGIVGMQASTIKASRDAKFRADAGLLANELIGQMWVGNRDGAALQGNFETGGPIYAPWATRVAATLPGAGAIENPPLVTVTPGVVGPPQTSSTVTVVVRWQAPNELPSPLNPAGTVRSYSVVVQII
jgi:type IV pilus assembly protein PilV